MHHKGVIYIIQTCTTMECILQKGEVFKSIIDAIKDLRNDANIDFAHDGLQIQAMDSAHISLCSLLMRTELFKSFTCPDAISLGINMKTLAMVLSGAKGELHMRSDGETLKLTVHKLDGVADYTLKLMDIDSENLGLPDTEYQTVAVLPSNTFAKVVKDLTNFSDSCAIRIRDHLQIGVNGHMGQVSWKSGEECACSVIEPMDAAMFSMRYLCFFSKGSMVSKKCIIGVSPNLPMCITYPIEEMGHLRFYLAPKMNE